MFNGVVGRDRDLRIQPIGGAEQVQIWNQTIDGPVGQKLDLDLSHGRLEARPIARQPSIHHLPVIKWRWRRMEDRRADHRGEYRIIYRRLRQQRDNRGFVASPQHVDQFNVKVRGRRSHDTTNAALIGTGSDPFGV